MKTLNQIVLSLNQIANAHYQIKSFGSGNVQDFATSGTTLYPAMWVETLDTASVTGGSFQATVTVYLADRLIKGDKNELEVLSDLQQVALDIIAQYMNTSIYGFKLITDNITLNPFRASRLDDEDAGYYFDLTFKQAYTYNSCQIPFNSTITNTSVESQLVTILDQDGNTITTLVGGETYSVIVVSNIYGGNASSTYSNSIIQA